MFSCFDGRDRRRCLRNLNIIDNRTNEQPTPPLKRIYSYSLIIIFFFWSVGYCLKLTDGVCNWIFFLFFIHKDAEIMIILDEIFFLGSSSLLLFMLYIDTHTHIHINVWTNWDNNYTLIIFDDDDDENNLLKGKKLKGIEFKFFFFWSIDDDNNIVI